MTIKLLIGCAIAALIGLHVLCTDRIQQLRNPITFEDPIDAPLLPNSVIKILAGEFKGLAADFLIMEIGAYLDSGEESKSKDWDRIALHFSQAMALDPYFAQTYQMVQAYLPWNGRVEQGNQLLEISRQHITWDWYPSFFIGFNYFYFLKDYPNAARYLLETSKMPDAPAILATLGARFSQKSGQTQASIAFLETMLNNPEYDEEAKLLIQWRIDLLKIVLKLEAAIERYKAIYGKPIEKLDDLISAGLIESIPVHPEDGIFSFENGKLNY